MRGCLVIHGLSTTTATMLPLHDALVKAGYKVAMPLLAGHGGDVDDLAATSWEEWYETVRIAFIELRREVDRVYYAGLSLGGLLGLQLAIDEGWGVRAMALLGTPLKLPLLSRLQLTLVKNTPLRWLITSVERAWAMSMADPKALKAYKQFALDRIPLNAAYEVLDLQEAIESHIREITNPLLLLYGKKDPTAPPYNIDLIRGRVSSDVIESFVFDRSKHIVTMDYDKAAVIKRTLDFFARFA